MARRIEHRSTSEWSAEQVHAALINPDYLRERLAVLGGTRTELLEHAETAEGVRYRLRQGVPADRLPSFARSVLGGDLLIERTETWRENHPGHYGGEVAVAIPGVPGSITGSLWLRDIESATAVGTEASAAPVDPDATGRAGVAAGSTETAEEATRGDDDGDDTSSAGSEFVVDGQVRINIPLISGKLEELVSEEVQKLLDAEKRFTAEWLAEHDPR